MSRKTTHFAAAVLAALALGTGAAQATELRIAHGYPPNSSGDQAFKLFADVAERESGGEITSKIYAMSLLSFTEAAPGLRDGIADVALILTPYFASDFPMTAALMDTGAIIEASDAEVDGHVAVMALLGAATEQQMLGCPACRKEFADRNIVNLSVAAGTRYSLLCSKPIRTMEDLQGARIRVGGSYWSNWAEAVGATTVQISGSEVYEGLGQGIIDCNVSAVAELINFSLADVADSVNLSGPGSVFMSTFNSVNADAWRSLDDAGRAALLKAAAASTAFNYFGYQRVTEESMALARERGFDIVENDPGIAEATRTFAVGYLEDLPETYRKRLGVEGLEPELEELQSLYRKWLPIAAEIDGEDALAQALWDQVYARVDLSAYGM